MTQSARRSALVRPLDVGAPFQLEATVRLLQRRAANRVDSWDGERYARVLTTPAGPVGVEARNDGTVDAPAVRYTVQGAARGDPADAARDDAERVTRDAAAGVEPALRRLLGADTDPALLQRVADVDCGTSIPPGGRRALRETALALRGVRIPRYPTLFEAFANVVPFQQVSLDAGIAIVGRLVERFGQELDRGRKAFPPAAVIAQARTDALRACGLSGRKAETLRTIARTIESGGLDESVLQAAASDEAATMLVRLPGIGPWSAAMVLLRGLGRADVFPPGDVGARRVLGELLRLPPDAGIEQLAQRFGPVRGGLYFCALGSTLLARGLIRPVGDRQAAP